MEGNLE